MSAHSERRAMELRESNRFTLFIVLFSLPFLAAGVWGILRGTQTGKWPRTMAIIRQPEPNTSTLNYEYSVDASKFVGETIAPFSPDWQTWIAAGTFHKKYPTGARVEIAYDPRDPTTAYLQPGPSSLSLLLISIGTALLFIALVKHRRTLSMINAHRETVHIAG